MVVDESAGAMTTAGLDLKGEQPVVLTNRASAAQANLDLFNSVLHRRHPGSQSIRGIPPNGTGPDFYRRFLPDT